jgi:mannose-6-phosphate isomerase-like protein (cupin superfamily)
MTENPVGPRTLTTRGYDPSPHYPVRGGEVALGWEPAAATLPAGVRVLAVDGPAVLNWEAVGERLGVALAAAVGAASDGDGPGRVEVVDVRDAARPWPEVLARTESTALEHDPDFATLAGGTLADLMDPAALAALAALPAPDGAADRLTVLVGPGAALADADLLWWVDLPKRYAEAAVGAGHGRHLAAPADLAPTTRRLFYIDWPLLDRHRDAMAGRIDRWFDVTDTDNPVSVGGEALRATCRELATRPFRTRPTFNTTPWGGHWAQRELGLNQEAENTALGYELIAPESGVLLGADDDPARCVEVPFQLVVALAPVDVLGPAVHDTFGTSFPIRFDYLDTVDGGNLSVHCHPQTDFMRQVFGWPYTQHESYYLMVAGETSKVFLGLRDGADVGAFHHAAHQADSHAVPFDIEEYVQTFPAEHGQLYLVPAGTPHGSGEGNVVLEVSATPYLYSLRFYDWLRRDSSDKQRKVHVEHAFRNLDPARSGAAVGRDLVQRPRAVAGGDGWQEELIGALPDMFFEVRRIAIEPDGAAEQHTAGRFHVLTVVDGDGALVTTAAGHTHRLNYAETLAVPASVGGYRVRNQGPDRVRLVKAQVT